MPFTFETSVGVSTWYRTNELAELCLLNPVWYKIDYWCLCCYIGVNESRITTLSHTYLEMSVTGLKSNLGAKALLSCSETIARTTEPVFYEGIYELLSWLKYEQSYLLGKKNNLG